MQPLTKNGKRPRLFLPNSGTKSMRISSLFALLIQSWKTPASSHRKLPSLGRERVRGLIRGGKKKAKEKAEDGVGYESEEEGQVEIIEEEQEEIIEEEHEENSGQAELGIRSQQF
jgi:hypothetical protein